MSDYKPTVEQQAVIDAFCSAERPTLVVQAGAGCGKSSTLRLAAKEQPARRGLYIVYNRALAAEAKRAFPPAVDCRTAHSLAFGPMGSQYRERLDGPRVPAHRVAQVLGINNPVLLAEDLAPLTPTTLARMVMEGVGNFLNSADPEPDVQHIRRVEGYSDLDNRNLAKYLAPFMAKAWADLQLRHGGQLKFTHDVYLKLYQLSRPRIPVDYVLLDEAQDLSPVMASLFHYQDHAQRIMVGDSAQAIYGFRGAIDAMDKFVADQHLTLTQSFRFGPAVAAEANKWLALLRAPLRLRGFSKVPSRIGRCDPQAILCRSNAGAMAQIVASIGSGKRTALVGGGDELRRLAEAAQTLMAKAGTSHPELLAFKDWDQVREHASQDDASGSLKVLVDLVDTHGPARIIEVVSRLVDEQSAEVVVSTAHRAKGREWGRVQIAPDFREPRIDPATGRVVLNPDELRLAYVAVTRGRLELDRTGLAWVDWVVDAVPGVRMAPALQPVPVPAQRIPEPVKVPEPMPGPAAVEDLAGCTEGPGGTLVSPRCLRCGLPQQQCGCKVPPLTWSAITGLPRAAFIARVRELAAAAARPRVAHRSL